MSQLPIYTSKSSLKSLWQEYRIYRDRLEFDTLFGRMTIPFNLIERVEVAESDVKGLLKGNLLLKNFRSGYLNVKMLLRQIERMKEAISMQNKLSTHGRSLTRYWIWAIVLLVLVSSLALGGCSKHSLFAVLIEHERKNAKLIVKTENLSYGKITYLTNTTAKSETPIIMLHGFGGEKDNWNRFSKKLTDDYRLIIPDLPGHGGSVQDFSLNYGIEAHAKRLKQFLDALGIKKAHFVGNSMGGAISMRYAFLYPQSVLSLTLIDSAGAVKTPSEFDSFMKTTGKNPMLEIENAQDFQNMMTKYVFVDPPYLPGFVIDILVEEKLKRKAMEQKMFRELIVDLDQMSTLSAIQSPTLIIWGAQDKLIHADNAELLHQKISGSQKEVLEGVGHCPMIEKPEVTTELYRRFLHGIGS